MLNNYERIKIKRLETTGEINKWIEGKNTNLKLKKYEPNKERVSHKIKQIRGEKTLSEFGSLIGVSHSSVSLYENQLAIPRDKIIRKIISLTKSPKISFEEFLFGFPKEYLKDIFGGIRDLEEGDRAEFYIIMEDFLANNKAYYSYEDSLISKAIEFFPSLKFSPDFIILARLYGIEKQNIHLLNFNVNKYEQSKDRNYRYEVELREEFHTYIMPLLEKELHKFDDLEEVAVRLQNMFSLLEFEQHKQKK